MTSKTQDREPTLLGELGEGKKPSARAAGHHSGAPPKRGIQRNTVVTTTETNNYTRMEGNGNGALVIVGRSGMVNMQLSPTAFSTGANSTGANSTGADSTGANQATHFLKTRICFLLLQIAAVALTTAGLILLVRQESFSEKVAAFFITTASAAATTQILAMRKNWSQLGYLFVHTVFSFTAFAIVVHPTSGFFDKSSLEGAATAYIVVLAPVFAMAVYNKHTGFERFSILLLTGEAKIFLRCFSGDGDWVIADSPPQQGEGQQQRRVPNRAKTTIVVKFLFRLQLLVLTLIYGVFFLWMFWVLETPSIFGLLVLGVAQLVPFCNLFNGALRTEMSVVAWMTSRVISIQGCICIMYGMKLSKTTDANDEMDAYRCVMGLYFWMAFANIFFTMICVCCNTDSKFVLFKSEEKEQTLELLDLVDDMTEESELAKVQAAVGKKDSRAGGRPPCLNHADEEMSTKGCKAPTGQHDTTKERQPARACEWGSYNI